MTKPRFTRQQHVELGLLLATIRSELLHQSARIDNHYPKGQTKAANILEETVELIDRARLAMEAEYAEENPHTGNEAVYIYFPQEDLKRIVLVDAEPEDY